MGPGQKPQEDGVGSVVAPVSWRRAAGEGAGGGHCILKAHLAAPGPVWGRHRDNDMASTLIVAHSQMFLPGVSSADYQKSGWMSQLFPLPRVLAF